MILQTCETESVAMNTVFCSPGAELVDIVASTKTAVITEEINDLLKVSTAIFKENMSLKEALSWNIEDDEFIGKYLHNEGQIVAAVKIRRRLQSTVPKN